MAGIIVSLDPMMTVAKFRQRELANLSSVVPTIQKSVKLYGPRIVQEEIARTQPTPVDRGNYRRNWKAENLPDGAVIYNWTPYASIIEHGRRPGSRMPPLAALEEWVVRKGLVDKMKSVTAYRRATGREPSKRPVSDAVRRRANQVRGLAFVIGRAITKRGLPPKKVLMRTESRLSKIVFEAVRKVISAHIP